MVDGLDLRLDATAPCSTARLIDTIILWNPRKTT